MDTSFHILLVVTGNQYSEPPSSAIKFPIAADLVNYTKNIKEVSEINIPTSLVQERMEEMDDNGELTVRTAYFCHSNTQSAVVKL